MAIQFSSTISDSFSAESVSSSTSTTLPFLSVIVPVYNGTADIPLLMDCLAAQTYPSDRVEYLLVDNNSQDNTAELLQAAIARLNAAGGQFHYLLEANIQSSYAARNEGIRAAKGEILVFTDADCRPEPQWLSEIVQPFQEAGVGLVAGEIVSAPAETFLERYSDYVEVLSQKHTLKHAHAPYGQTANLAVRREAFEIVGLFRPYLTTGGDADMCWRIQAAEDTANAANAANATGAAGETDAAGATNSDWQIRLAENARVAHRHRTTLEDLRNQWKRYGRSNAYLHEIHGVPLMPRPYVKVMVRTFLRWFVKEFPHILLQVLQGRVTVAALVCVPIGIYCNWFRYQGQVEAKLPEEAIQIAWLEKPAPDPVPTSG